MDRPHGPPSASSGYESTCSSVAEAEGSAVRAQAGVHARAHSSIAHAVQVEGRDQPLFIRLECCSHLRPARERASREQRVRERERVLPWSRLGTIVVLPVVYAVVGDNEDGGALSMRRAQLQEVRCQVGVKIAHQPIRWLVPLEVDLRRVLKVGGPGARSDPVGVAACPARACHEMRGTPT